MSDRQRWEKIREIFEAALELPADDRDSFVQSASHGDEEICAEVDLLLRAEEDAGDFLEAPMAPGSLMGPDAGGTSARPPLQPGDVLCNRFRILRLVGEGGMGHVFEAWDAELNRPVALKAIRPEIASHPESLKRFRREVSLALSITHPNVCRTFDLERDQRIVDAAKGLTQEIVFLTMEFLDGETLSAKIARGGPLPLTEALRIAGHIADALDSAHAQGILHRDIKPANVMLVQPAGTASVPANSVASASLPRAVITDFGLARQDALFQTTEQSAISRSGFPAGTLAYMAPEQLEAGPTSAATDIYAFGLVLFEMAAGRRAFPSSSPLSGIRQRLAGPPPSAQFLIPGLPEPWRRAIDGCLRTNPADRYQSAADVIEVLKGGNVALPRVRIEIGAREIASRLISAPLAAWSRWSHPRRVLASAIFFLTLVSLSYGALRLIQVIGDSESAHSVKPGALVYLTQVKNKTGEKTFDNLTELLQAGLTQSTRITLLDQGRVGDTLQNMTRSPDSKIDDATAREIALRTGAVRVIFCTVTRKDGSYQLNVDIQRPDGSILTRYRSQEENTFYWQSSGATNPRAIPPELLSTVRDTTSWIRMKVGESQYDIGRLDAPPDDVTTGSWEALSDYDEALRAQDRQETEKAIVLLQKATGVDPGFALAYARAGDFQVAMGQHWDGYQSYQKALDLSRFRRLTTRERYRIQGLFALDSGDYNTAEKAFRDYASSYPHDYLGWFYRGYPLMMLGREEEAIETLTHAYQLDSLQPSPASQLGIFKAAAGDFDGARSFAAELSKSNFHVQAQYIDALIAFLEGRYSDSSDIFAQLAKAPNAASSYLPWSLALRARVSAERGQFAEAARLLEEGLRADASQGNSAGRAHKLIDLAYLSAGQGHLLKSREQVTLALTLDRSPQTLEQAAAILGKLAEANPSYITLLKGDLARIESISNIDNYGIVSDVSRLCVRGYFLIAKHQWNDAIKEFRNASTLDAPSSPRDYLAFGLIVAARHNKDRDSATQMNTEALNLQTPLAIQPSLVWRRPMDFPPGYLADELQSYLVLSEQLHETSSASEAGRRIFSALRPK